MLDLLLKASEKLVELLKYRQERGLRHFQAFVEPVYESLLAVHADYLSMFRHLEARRPISTMQDLRDAIADLRQRRVSHEAERRALADQSRTLAAVADLAHLRPFFNAVERYFDPLQVEPWNTPSMKLIQALEELAPPLVLLHERDFTYTDGSRRYGFDTLVEKHIKELQNRWTEISQQYARAKVAAAT